MSASPAHASALRAATPGRAFLITLGVSLGLHVAILVIYAIWEGSRVAVLDMPEEPIRATLVKLGKPRDPKLLPRLDTAPKPVPKDTSVPVPTLDAKKREETLSSAVDRIREAMEREKAKQDALARVADRVGPADKDEEGQEDGSPEGDSATPSQINAYLGMFANALRRNFVVPSVIQSQAGLCDRLATQVLVKIAADGTVKDGRVYKASGNDLFDSAVMQALKAVPTFSPPPENMRKLAADGFAFKFRCEG